MRKNNMQLGICSSFPLASREYKLCRKSRVNAMALQAACSGYQIEGNTHTRSFQNRKFHVLRTPTSGIRWNCNLYYWMKNLAKW